MAPLIQLLIMILEIYLWIIIASVIVSWLAVFNVLNTRNRWVYKGYSLLNQATEPALRRLRRFIPPAGGIDFSPIVLIFAIYLAQAFLHSLLR